MLLLVAEYVTVKRIQCLIRKLILGPPGTGKTTTLVKLVEEELLRTAPERVVFLSYTNAAIASMQEKIGFINAPYFRTLHSLCYRILKLTNDLVLDKNHQTHFEKVMGEQGVKVSLSYDDNTVLTRKNQPLSIYHLAKNRCETIEQVMYEGIYDVSLSLVNDISVNYKGFKDYYKIFDFTDMLEKVLEFPPLDVDTVFVDEAQDLTPLQWKVVEHLFSKAKRIIIAGDDDQAIYEWSGAKVEHLLDMEYTEKEVLHKSHRLSPSILEYSKTITKHIINRFDKQIIAGDNQGELKNLISVEHILDLIIDTIRNDETWYFLARNVYMLDMFSDLFFAVGIPFIKRGKRSIPYGMENAIGVWKKGYKGGELGGSELKMLAKYQSKYDIDRPWYDTFDKVAQEKVVYIRRILANRLRIKGTIPIFVDTIHSTKGKEADHVVLLPDVSTTTRRMFNRYPDREHRVWYVGSTRSRGDLYIMDNKSPFFYKP